MAEIPHEYIIEFEHEVLYNDDSCKVVMKAKKLTPLVRCKDCKWYEIRELKKDGTDDRRYKPSLCMLTGQTRKSTHFCADGKPKDGES